MGTPIQKRISAAAVVVASCLATARPAAANDADEARAECESALAAEHAGGRPGSSRLPCQNAYIRGNKPRDMRNQVVSMLGVGTPSLDDLVVATLVADAAVRVEPNGPWGYAARCEIARRLGNADVLEACLRDLRTVAPHDPLTTTELALSPELASPLVWFARVALLLALLGTLAHALGRAGRRRRVSTPVKMAVAVAMVVAGALGVSTPARAAAPQDDGAEAMSVPAPKGQVPQVGHDLSRFKIDEANPEASVPTPEQASKSPLQFGYYIQDLLVRAERASKKGDHAAAARYYRALSAVSPQSSVGPRGLCIELQAAADVPNAIVACRTALTRGGTTAADYTRFVEIALAKPGPLAPLEAKELYVVTDHLAKEAKLGPMIGVLRCQIAVRANDTAALASCVDELEKEAPNDPKTISFAWALALDHQDRGAALRLVDRARELGMKPEGVARMEEATSAMTRKKVTRFALIGLAIVVLGVAATLGARRLRGASAVSA